MLSMLQARLRSFTADVRKLLCTAISRSTKQALRAVSIEGMKAAPKPALGVQVSVHVSLANQPDMEEESAAYWTRAIAAAVSSAELEAAVGPVHKDGLQVSVTDVTPGQGSNLPAGQGRPASSDPVKDTNSVSTKLIQVQALLTSPYA